MRSGKPTAFSLVEIALALGVIALALVAIFGLIPVGLNASRDATNDTQTTMISEDVYNRVRLAANRGVYFDGTFARAPLTTGPSPVPTPVSLPAPWTGGAAAPAQTISWFYDINGLYRDEAMTGTFSAAYYRVDVQFGSTWAAGVGGAPTPDPGLLRPVVAKILWPVNTTDGTAINSNNNKVFTFFIRKP
jgi:type II secretory pathway pseudopilin PulG